MELLAKLYIEIPKEVLSNAIKVYSKVVETRDAVHPRFVTKTLTGILRAVGQPHPDILNGVGGVPKGMEHGMFPLSR